jgi:hypothetical protein
LIKLLLVFLLMGALLGRKANLALTMLFSGLGLIFLFHIPFPEVLRQARLAAIGKDNLGLIGIMYLILVLEKSLRACGLFDRLLSSLRTVVPDRRVVMAALPALIGFLPSFGGVLFSAPMVEEAALGSGVSRDKMAFINYWFRHIWEGVFPLYPSLLLASVLSAVSVPRLISILWPVTAVSCLAGALVAFHHFPREEVEWRRPPIEALRDLFISLAPFLAVILGVLLFHLNMPATILGVALLILLLFKLPLREAATIFFQAWRWDVFFMILSIFFFKGLLEASDGIGQLAGFLTRSGIPLLGLVAILPLAIGFMTGMNAPYVAISFPILSPLLPPSHHAVLLAFAFVCGNIGCLISPTHSCLAMSHQYFGSSFGPTYRLMAVPVLAVAVTALCIASPALFP